MSSDPMFRVYLAAVDALRDYCGGSCEKLNAKESPTEFSFTDKIEMKDGWEQKISTLATKLRDAFFEFTLLVKADRYRVESKVLIDAGLLVAICESAEDTQETFPLPNEAVGALENFQTITRQSLNANRSLELGEVFRAINELTAKGASVEATVKVSLSKNQIRPESDLLASEATLQKVIFYLFAENLERDLVGRSLESFEEDFCGSNQRSVIVVFDSPDFRSGEQLAVCGPGHDNELKAWLTTPLSQEILERITKTLDFRKSESLGDFQIKWLTPEFFALKNNPAEADSLNKISEQFRSFQALLSALYLGDYIERSDEGHRVEYRGIKITKVLVGRNLLLEQKRYLDSLFRLYSYGYEGFSTDKLEIVQQFLSLMATNIETLCSKAVEIREAAEKNYAIVLKDKISVYFDALDKIKDRIKIAVDKSAEGVISLSRDVSGDVYKIAGVIAVAIATALLKPDFGWSAALAASLVIAVYLGLVVFYHLPTLQRAYDLNMNQHAGYIESFGEILGPTKITEFLNNDHLKQAKNLFSEKSSMAETIYTFFLAISILTPAILLGNRLLCR